VRGGLSVTQRYDPIEEVIASGEREALITYGIGFVLVVVAGWFLLEVLRRRWFDLARKVDELEASQSQLLQSEKMASIGLLAAGIAHEINNPVGYVQSNLKSLERYLTDLLQVLDAYEHAEAQSCCPEECLAQVRQIKQRVDIPYLREDVASLMRESEEGISRVRKIIQDLKDFSHVGQEETWQEADLHRSLESTLNVVWNELKYKARVVREYGELPEIRCIPSQLNQVFMNLLINAAQAIEDKGTITIRTGLGTGAAAGEAWVEIEDDGKGIPPENLKKIFDPFFTTKPIGKGTGLGLSVSHGIVQKHGGHIEVASREGQGTRFRIWLPVAGGPAQPGKPT
jgi:two-component system NtrC family sensor kinase